MCIRDRANILTILSQEYGVDEDDFLSAEIEVVPAGEARDYGRDRSMIMVCLLYTSKLSVIALFRLALLIHYHGADGLKTVDI